MNKKKIILIIAIVIVVIILIPHKYQLKDGGTIGYKAISWEYIKYHAIDSKNESFYEGNAFKIFGIEVYNDAKLVKYNFNE